MYEILIRNEYENLDDILSEFNVVIKDVIEASASYLNFSLDGKEVSILLTNDSEIHKLNKDFRGKDKPTNVLSFETEDDEMLGDIVVSIDTVLKEVKEQGKEFKNHFVHLIVHGFLHLLGYDHLDDSEADEMEGLEIEIMESMGLDNPY
ncbi:MAG: rRNA maturation RNase YbeY [Alphaproteobacteria bacterium]|jgi:probable rRNA maturation factor|nr:rRNA maturation RNase YbeY [Alphaproteobacteria bacterium]